MALATRHYLSWGGNNINCIRITKSCINTMIEFSITQDDLESLADTYDKIRQAFKEKNLSQDKALSKDLENHLRVCITDLSDKLAAGSIDEVLQLQAIYSKYKLFEICIIKVSELFNYLSPNSGRLIDEIFKKMFDVFNYVFEKAVKTTEEKNEIGLEYEQMQKELEQVLRAAEGLEKNVMVIEI